MNKDSSKIKTVTLLPYSFLLWYVIMYILLKATLYAFFRMIQSNEYDITLVSRGNWHYDSNIRIKPYVEALVCDRNRVPQCDNCSINALKHCQDLVRLVSETKTFDVVLDFSAYQPKWVHDAVDLLNGKEVGVYIYISSDAVYEVSKPKSSKRLSKGKAKAVVYYYQP